MSNRILVSTRKGLFHVVRNSDGWVIDHVDFLGDNVTLTLSDHRSGYEYAALDHGHFGVKMHRNKGTGWEEIAAPAYPPKPPDLDEKDPWGRTVEWTTARIWALQAGGNDEPGVLWCGTLPGGLFRSNDHGDTWEIVRPLWDHPLRKKWMGGGADLPGIHSILVDPRNSRRIWIAVSTGGVWFSEDSGASWTIRGNGLRAEYVPPELVHDPVAQDVHSLAQCHAHPERMWIQHHNGIFVSSDEGATFRELTNIGVSTFGFPVVVHPEDPDRAWFIPEIKDEKRIPDAGRLVVSRTRDGGKTFKILTNGLPQSHAYDVVYRHAFDIDRQGNRLAFGSTTGGLWVSEDQGDRWAMISHTLPPVYAVRFA